MSRKRDVVQFDAHPDSDDKTANAMAAIGADLERRLVKRLTRIARDFVENHVRQLQMAVEGDGDPAGREAEATHFREGRMTYEELIQRAQTDYDEIGQRQRQTCDFSEFFEINRTLYEGELSPTPKLKFGVAAARSDANDAFTELRQRGHLHDDDEKLFTRLFNEEVIHA